MPPADPGAGAALLQTFKAEAQKKGPAAAIQWLVNSKSAGPLQALIKTPQGRMALAAAALGFTAGFAGGANAPKVQALVTALKGVFDQNLPPAQAAQQIVQVLKAALTGGKAAKPIAPDRTAENRRVQSLTTSLKNAQANLKETEQLLRQRPGDQDLQIIFKGQTAQVRELQAKLDALKKGPAKPSTGGSSKLPAPKKPVTDPKLTPPIGNGRVLPRTIEELNPWLQGEVRSGRMPFARAVEITKNEWIRRSTMPDDTPRDSNEPPPKRCNARVEIVNDQTVDNGKIEVDSSINVTVRGSAGTVSTKIKAKAVDPTTNKTLKTQKGGGPGRSSEIQFFTEMVKDYVNPPPSPIVEVEASCKFDDGMVVPAVVEQITNNR